MKITVISDLGTGLGLAMKLSAQGHSVSIGSTSSLIGAGLVPQQDGSPVDLTIYDSHSRFSEADALLKEGKRVLGTSQWASLISNNKEYAHAIMRMAGWEEATDTDGINLTITGWFNGTNYIAATASLAYTRLMSGGKGPIVGCTGIVASFNPVTSKVYDEILAPLIKILRKVTHRGCFTVKTCIKDTKFTVSSIDASLDLAQTYLLFENCKQSPATIILHLLDDTSKPLSFLDKWGACVLVTLPPFPYYLPDIEPVAIKGLTPGSLKHIWFGDVQRNGEWCSAGSSGRICYVTSRGVDLVECSRRVYRTLNNITIQDAQYRDDIGKNLYGLVDSLRRNGWMS